MDLAGRLDLLERMAATSDVDISTHTEAIRRRIESIEKRLYGDRVSTKTETAA